jgi:hypothetical protein
MREEFTKGPRLAARSPDCRDDFIPGTADASCSSEVKTKVFQFSIVYCARLCRKKFCIYHS